MRKISTKVARDVGEVLGVDWKKVDINQFKRGLVVEQEHTDVTKGNLELTGMIALAHLREYPDYYTRLKKVEG